MLKNILAIFSLLFLCSCIPSKKVASLKNSDRLASLNKQIQNKQVKIIPIEGPPIESKNVTLSADSIFYSNADKKSLPISSIRSIVVTPGLSASTIIACSLFGLGAYSILSPDHSDNIPAGMRKFYGGIELIGLGIGVIIFGNNLETKIYYFNKKSH